MSARLKARTIAVASVTDRDRDRLFSIFHRYYDQVSRDQFEQDFSKKDDVILLSTPDGVAHGFSTLQNLELVIDGRRVRGVFSGDTVIEQEYWGQGSLGVEFLKYLFRQMARAPLTPFYWFLISKGYKTYLLMANNFDAHWPRHESETPAFEREVMRQVSSDLFGDAYDDARGLVCFEQSMGQLKDGVAAVTDELCEQNPRVAFFAERNPTWAEGTELVCLARMSWAMPFTYWWKVMRKTKKKPKQLSSDAPGGTPARSA
jgi:hypothetical protein